MRKFIPFRQKGSGPNSPEDADSSYQRRREQVRRAQRTHRERKEAYVKSLESEVLKLRASEADLLQENRSLHAEIARLRGKLASNGIQDEPVAAPTPWHPHEMTATAFPDRNATGPIMSLDRDESQTLRLGVVRHPGAAATPKQQQQTASSPSASPTSSSSLAEVTQQGLDFVLTLEAPCLPHLHAADGSGVVTAGHALTASAALLEGCPLQDPTHQPEPVTWQTTSAGLERLLELAEGIETEGELTPVQCWNLIRQHPRFGELRREPARLRELTREVALGVSCVGFGAVIDQETFEGLLERACEWR